MTRSWVGIITASFLVLTLAGTAVSAPHPAYVRDEFQDAGNTAWDLVQGNLSYETQIGSANDLLTFAVLEDDDDWSGIGPSRMRSGVGTINASMDAYMIHAIMQRDADYTPATSVSAVQPRWLGITFGETPGLGYYMVSFDDGVFRLSVPNATSGAHDIVHTQTDWGTVPAWVHDVDARHRYTVFVDGTTLRVHVDGWELGSFTLPSIPVGQIGLATGEDTRVYSEQLIYGPLDNTPPTVEIWRPQDATVYLFDEPIAVPATGVVVVAGEFTIGTDIFDDVIGTRAAYLYLDGKLQAGQTVLNPGILTNWTVDLTGFAPGYHTITVEAHDWAGNKGSNSTEVLVVGTGTPDGNTVASAVRIVTDVVGPL